VVGEGLIVVGALGLLFRGELRRRWASWLVLTLLLGVAAGSVMGAVAAGRRTSSAFPGFNHRYGYDAFTLTLERPTILPRLPEVTSVATLVGYPTPNFTVGGKFLSSNASNFMELPPSSAATPVKSVEGHLPGADSPDDIAVSYQLAQIYGLRPGSVWPVRFYTSAQEREVLSSSGSPPADGSTIRLHVVGTEVNVLDFFNNGGPTYSILLSPGFARAHPGLFGLYWSYIRLRHGLLSYPRLIDDLPRLNRYGLVYDFQLGGVTAGASGALGPQATGWWILGGLAALAGIAIVWQAFSREALVQAESYATLRAVGARPRDLVALAATTSAVVGVLAAVIAVSFAWWLSAFTPVGIARVVEASSGMSFDTPVLVVGAVATVGIALLAGVVPARRLARRQAAALSAAPAEVGPVAWTWLAPPGGRLPSALVGTRRALEAGTGRRHLPVATAMFGTGLAVATLVATVVFGAGLRHLVTTPPLYGRTWQLQLSNNLSEPQAARIVRVVERTQGVAAVDDGVASGFVSVGGSAAQVVVVRVDKGEFLFPTVTGREPVGDDEVMLGEQTLARAGAHIGSTVLIRVPRSRQAVPFVVVGTTTFEPSFSSGGLGTGAVLTLSGALRAACGSLPSSCQAKTLARNSENTGWGVIVRFAPGRAGARALAMLSRRLAPDITLNETPQNLVNFGTAVNFPLLLGLVLALLGIGTFVHLMVVSVARRRREIGLLKALGFVRRQVAATVCWQATAVASVAILIGVPLGIAVGRVVWHTFAFRLGAVPVDVVPVTAVVLLAAGVLVVANVIALLPALSAARLKPSEALREP